MYYVLVLISEEYKRSSNQAWMSWNPDEIQKHVTSVLGNCFCCAANLDSSGTAGTNSHGCHCSVITSCTSNLWVDWTHLTRGLQVLLQYKHRGEQGTISFGCDCRQKEAIEFLFHHSISCHFCRFNVSKKADIYVHFVMMSGSGRSQMS